MYFSGEQQTAIDLICHWYRGPKPYFHLGGYAGTGKTYTMKGVIETLQVERGTILCAYTAKAAKNLERKAKLMTSKPAKTIHNTIYSYHPNKELNDAKRQLRTLRNEKPSDQVNQKIEAVIVVIQKLIEACEKSGASFQRKESLGEINLIIADECSMISEAILIDLLSFGVKVLFVGDHGQLPPINKDGKTLHDLIPLDFELKEIQRHDNDIVTFAEMARKRSFIPYRESLNGFGKITKKQALEGDYLGQFDQVICHMNKTRRLLNKKMRSIQGLSTVYPCSNEKVVCRFNNARLGISRGSIYRTTKGADKVKNYLNLEIVEVDGIIEDETSVEGVYILKTDPQMFDAYDDFNLADDIDKQRAHVKPFPPPFDFGYAITVHSAQGSEWPRVLVWDDYCGKAEEYPKWLYTAITRAEAEVIIAS